MVIPLLEKWAGEGVGNGGNYFHLAREWIFRLLIAYREFSCYHD